MAVVTNILSLKRCHIPLKDGWTKVVYNLYIWNIEC